MEFKGQNDKDWSDLTAFDEYLKDKKPYPTVWLKELIKEYNNDENLKGVLDKIPSKSMPRYHNSTKNKDRIVCLYWAFAPSMQKTLGL